jgi:predicted Ser/Thr protein kinase
MSIGADLPIGSELAGYRVESMLGRGGMGVVYRAHDLALDRPVALKILAPELAADEAFRDRFLRESRLAASIDHPNVIPVYDAGEIAGELYIAMRFVDGRDLKAILAEGPPGKERAVAIASQVAAALDAAHARGLVHRDVKPSNVLVGDRDHVYLADFGLTRQLGDAAAALGASRSLGTADYISPEQIRGDDVDGRADVYSLACVLQECLTGEPPFRRPSELATLYAHLEEQPAEAPGLESVMRTALAKDPDERYKSGGELLEAARSALGLEPRRMRWPLAVAAVGLALIGAALLAFFLTRDSVPTAPTSTGRLIRIDPSTDRVGAAASVGAGSTAVAVGSGRVWVTSYSDDTLWQYDGRRARQIPSVGRPFAVSVDGGDTYVAETGSDPGTENVTLFDTVTAAQVGGTSNYGACSLTSGPAGVWAAGCPDVQELRADAGTPRKIGTVGSSVPISFARPLSAANYREVLSGMAEGDNAVWVIGDEADQRLWRIDPRRHRVAAMIELGFPPGEIAAGGGAVWVTDELRDRLVKVDPATNRIVASIPVGAGAYGVAVGLGSVWVGNAIAHTVTRVDPVTNRIEATIPVAASPRAIATGEGSVWVVGDAR